MKIRIPIPAGADATSYAIAAAGHLLLLAVLLGFVGLHGATGNLPPAMTVRLSGPSGALRGGQPQGARTTHAGPRHAEPAAPKAPKDKPASKRETTAEEPKHVAKKLAGATAQPENLPKHEKKPAGQPAPVKEPEPADAPDEAAKAPAGAEGGASQGVPGLPAGPIAGGIAGVTTDEPLGADWYVGLIVNRLQDAWRDRPILPTGEDAQRVVVAFVIQKDGRVTDQAVQTASGYTPLDASALRAAMSLGRLPPLPASYGKDRLRARFVFELTPAAP